MATTTKDDSSENVKKIKKIEGEEVLVLCSIVREKKQTLLKK